MMSRNSGIYLAVALVAIVSSAAWATDNHFGHHGSFFSLLSGGQEVPAISTAGGGKALIRVGSTSFSTDAAGDGAAINYVVGWDGLEGDVLQAHLHFGARATNGGVIAFLCSNLDSAPEGVQECPQRGVIHGSIDADGIIGPAGQGIAPGEIGEVIRALRNGTVYINVHSSLHPGGEIRGQVSRRFGLIDPLMDPTVLDVDTFLGGIHDVGR